jgi:hypothetical protein
MANTANIGDCNTDAPRLISKPEILDRVGVSFQTI